MAEPYSTRELYIEWLTSQNDISLDDDRMYATMTSLNKPAFEMVALLHTGFNLHKVLNDFYDNSDFTDEDVEKIITILVIRCSTSSDDEWSEIKSMLPTISEKIDTYKNLEPVTITTYTGDRFWDDNGPKLKDNQTLLWNSISLSQKCDFMMMNKSCPNIELLANTLKCTVNPRWIKMAAMHAIDDDLDCIRVNKGGNRLLWSDFITSNLNGVIYICSSNVSQLLTAITKLSPYCTIIWRLREGGPCINLSKLCSILGPLVENVMEFLCIACSIGLPLHRIFTSWQFLNQWVEENWYTVRTSEELALLSLRRRLKPLLKKLGTDVHWSQCIDWYRKEYNIFTLSLDNYEQYSDVDNVDIEKYFFEHIYSYPKPGEWTGLLIRLREIFQIGEENNYLDFDKPLDNTATVPSNNLFSNK